MANTPKILTSKEKATATTTRQVIVSVYSSIYSNVKDHETQNKSYVDTKFEQEKMAAASVLTSS